MAFACRAKADSKAQAPLRRTRLVGVRYDAGIEQRGSLERIFVQKIGADQLALDAGKSAVRRQRLFHDVSTRLERLQQITMTALEVLQHVRQYVNCNLRVECEH